MTEGRLQVWRVLQAVVALLVFGAFLLGVQELLNPFLFFWILVLVLLPFRRMPGYGLLVFVAAILTVYWLLATTGFLLAPFVLGFVFAYARMADALALTDCQLMAFSVDELRIAIRTEPDTAEAMVEAMIRRLTGTVKKLENVPTFRT